MSVRAIFGSGLPPYGLGLYTRDGDEIDLWWGRFVVVNASRGDYAAAVARAQARGLSTWLYRGPESFRPETWRDGLGRLVRQAEETGAVGIVVDPENGWPHLSRDERRGELAAFGAACGEASKRTRVGMTSFPLLPDLDAFAAEAGRGVWGSPQIYGASRQDAATFRRWYQVWEDNFGGRVVPSIAGWPASPMLSTPDGFREYLARLPNSGGAIVWVVAGPGVTPGASYIGDALRGYEPGGTSLGTFLLAARAWLLRPAGLATAGVALAILGAALLFATRGI